MPKSKSSAALSRDFGRWLKQQREAHGITQRVVAAKTNITTTQLSRIENGHSSTRRDTVILLAQIIGIDESEALRHFAPESFPEIPEELENIPFSEFDKQELKEIADFINFKLSLKRKQQQEQAAAADKTTAAPNRDPAETKLEKLLEKDSGEISSYRVKNGQLISDAKLDKKGHTKQKPPK
ncbi:MAG TPA: helix-turn-helix transcriptional regulator [Pyrinomonadaceae bacterium]|nr:helix-turn-helix transcriptional regulator [Pyrinomonadaceae bacterium]